MINFDNIRVGNIKPKLVSSSWSPYRTLIVGGSGSRKSKSLLDLINHQPNIDKIYLYAKDPFHDLNKRERVLMILKLLLSIHLIVQIKTQNFDSIWWFNCWYA